jgi:hypothetical protein
MVAIVVFYPQIVMHYKTAGTTVDPAAVQRSLDNLSVPGLDMPGGGGPPSFDFGAPPKIQ